MAATTLPIVGETSFPAPSTILGWVLTAIKFAYVSAGLDEPNVLPGSEHYVRAQKFTDQCAIAIANGQITEADSNPLTAAGTALVTLAGIFGVSPRPASPATGFALIACNGTVALPLNFVATAPDGQKYATIAAGTYTTGQGVQVTATTPGKTSNQAPGTVLTWDSAAVAALNPNATVDAGGLTGGANTDTDTVLRARLLDRLANPPVGGNWSQVVGWAEASSAAVELAYCYPAVQGPATYDVAVTAAGGHRSLASVATVRAYIAARMPGQNQLTVTSVTPYFEDVVLAAVLPLPTSAGGDGGGWRDPDPWPAATVKVTGYNSGTSTATCNGTVAPPVGASIGIWDPEATDPDGNRGLMREYTVATQGGSSGAYTFTVQGGFGGTTAGFPLGAYVSAGAFSLVQYAATFARAVEALGPGQKTALPELLPLGARQPTVTQRSPSDLTNRLLTTVEDAYPEVLDLNYAARFQSGTTTTVVSPPIPNTTADPPNIFVLKWFAIRAA